MAKLAEPHEIRGEPTWKGHWLNELDSGTTQPKSRRLMLIKTYVVYYLAHRPLR